jgi:phosphoribosyl-ATP pyrophosphohydrolase/phosphoribosyl-AMP cyclohydrolase
LNTSREQDPLQRLDWDKGGGMLPAVIQDAGSGAVLMLGYMTREALAATQTTGRVTFWSRRKRRLWTKGETSGHFLELKRIAVDCYTAKLLAEGTRRIAQKVGEEGLELALASVAQSDQEIVGEAADLLYHMLLLLRVKGLSLSQVIVELEARHAERVNEGPPADSP